MGIIGKITLEVVKRIKSDELKVKLIDRFESESDKIVIINCIENEEIRIQLVDKIQNEYSKTQIIMEITNPQLKLQAIEMVKNDENRVEIAKTIESEEIRLQTIDKIQKDRYKSEVAKTIHDLKVKKQAVGKISSRTWQMYIIEDIKDVDTKLQIIEEIKDDRLSIEIAKTIEESQIKLQIINKVEDWDYKREIAITIKEEEIRNPILDRIDDMRNYESITGNGEFALRKAKNIKDISLKLKALEKFSEKSEIIEIAETIDDPIIKLQIFDRLNNLIKKQEVAISIEDEELRLKAAETYFEYDQIKPIIRTIKNSNIRERLMKKATSINEVIDLALMWKQEEKKQELFEIRRIIHTGNSEELIEMFDRVDYIGIKIDIAIELAKIERKEYLRKVFPKILSNEVNIEEIVKIMNIAAQNDNENFIDEYMNDEMLFDNIVNSKLSYYDMSNIIEKMSKNKRFEFFKRKIKIEGNESILKSYLTNTENDVIISELDKIMETSGVKLEELSEKREIVMKMYETNNDVIRNIDYRILDARYIEKMGFDKINLISCYAGIQEKILRLSDFQLDVLVKCISTYIENAQAEDWTTMVNAILDNICGGEYGELLSDIQNLEEIDIDILRCILQSKNVFDIKNREQLSNYEKIKTAKTDELIKSENNRDKQQAVLQKVFGVDYLYAVGILNKYGQDIDSLPDSDIKYYMKSLQEIINCDSLEVLQEIYQECKDITFTDKVMTERLLKTEYGKLYNEGLLKVENLEKIDQNMYYAGTDFKMIITSLCACRDSGYTENYKDDWNRPFINSQTVSVSYIRNDMLGTASRGKLCYGFDEMSPNCLMEAGTMDIGSATESFKSDAVIKRIYNPNNMINNTKYYNEMVYRRIQNGKKRQPSYIVVFKIDGEIENLENAKKAQKDWGGLPIVVVDVNECLKAEKAKVEAMIQEYRINPNPQLAKDIYYKIKNNRQFSKGYQRVCFFEDIDIEQFNVEEQDMKIRHRKKKEKIVTENDLKENYIQVISQKTNGQMRKVFNSIHTIIEEGERIE